jgi:hypothetical protein
MKEAIVSFVQDYAQLGDKAHAQLNEDILFSFLEQHDGVPSYRNLVAAFEHLAPYKLWLMDPETGRKFAPGAAVRELSSQKFRALMLPREPKPEAESFADLSADEMKKRLEQQNPQVPDMVRRDIEANYRGWIAQRKQYSRMNNPEANSDIKALVFAEADRLALPYTFGGFDAAARSLEASGKLIACQEAAGVYKHGSMTMRVAYEKSAKPIHDRREIVIEAGKPRKFTPQMIQAMSADEYQLAMMTDPAFREAVDQMGQD